MTLPARSTTLLLAAIGLCWVLLVPPGAGPDEPSHLVRAGGVVRGQVAGTDVGLPGLTQFDLPDTFRVPEPGCYALQSTTAATCAAEPEHTGATVPLLSTAGNYPVWAHAAVGLPTLLPWPDPIWSARLAGMAISVALTAAALRVAGRHRGPRSAAVLAALTPLAWFTFGVVNPSSIAIAGAVALWVALLAAPGAMTAGWLAAAGSASVALPRRDGLIWLCIIVIFGLLASRRRALDWLRELPRGALATIAVTTGGMVVWSALQSSRVSQLAALAPLVVVAAELGRSWWARPHRSGVRAVGVVVVLAGVALAFLAAVLTRPGGRDWRLAQQIIGETGNNLVEAIGVLGWLDASVPWPAVIAVVAVVGMLAADSLVLDGRRLAVAAALVGMTIVTSWIFELYNGEPSGTYWQGRYSLPMLVGVPLILASGDDRVGRVRVDPPVIITSLVVLNVAAWATARRFGVGFDGSLSPAEWDTGLTPLPPLVVLIALGASTAALGVVLLRQEADQRSPRVISPSSYGLPRWTSKRTHLSHTSSSR